LQLALRLEKKYKIKILATDGYDAYQKYRIADNHIITKTETCLVESKNSLIRHYLARFNRRTKRYSKTFDMIFNSIFLFFNRKHLETIFV
jgi:insertion element IS1 protein InsB